MVEVGVAGVGVGGEVEEVVDWDVVAVEVVCRNLWGMVGILWRLETRIAGYSKEGIMHFQLKTNLIPLSFSDYFVL